MTDTTAAAKAPITHVLLATDSSGSMAPLANDVRGGFNTYIQGLRDTADGRYRITARLFDTTVTELCTAAKPRAVPELDAQNYVPGGGTALLDAVGELIVGFERATTLGEGERVLLVVQTDGEENSSREYKLDTIRHMITEREAGGRWACLFLGAGRNAWRQADGMGFRDGQTIRVGDDSQGTARSYSGLRGATRSYAAGASAKDVSGIVAAAAGLDKTETKSGGNP